MKLSDFILLNERQKSETVLHEGVLIAKRNTNECLVFLFQMENYYVESYCNRESKSIREFRAFTGIDLLHPYLDMIPIDHLLN